MPGHLKEGTEVQNGQGATCHRHLGPSALLWLHASALASLCHLPCWAAYWHCAVALPGPGNGRWQTPARGAAQQTPGSLQPLCKGTVLQATWRRLAVLSCVFAGAHLLARINGCWTLGAVQVGKLKALQPCT